VTVASTLELDLEIFTGPFDLLLAVLLREEVDLLELPLAEVVLAYIDHLEQSGELDLEAITEFLVLIAALLELKSRLMLDPDEPALEELEPLEAAEELLARMLEALRYRGAARHLQELLAGEEGVRFRSAPPPPELRRAAPDPPASPLDPSQLGTAIGQLLRFPPAVDLRHVGLVRVTLHQRLEHLRTLLRRGSFSFEEAVSGADRVTVAMTVFALLELYKRGEACWEQHENFGEIAVMPAAGRDHAGERVQPPARAEAASRGQPAG
jgi:segregation and condensation protein A